MADLPRLPEQLLSAIDMAAMLSRLGGRGYQVQEERWPMGTLKAISIPIAIAISIWMETIRNPKAFQATHCRVANRNRNRPSNTNNNLGFRVVLGPSL
jgi:hypothetical protein